MCYFRFNVFSRIPLNLLVWKSTTDARSVSVSVDIRLMPIRAYLQLPSLLMSFYLSLQSRFSIISRIYRSHFHPGKLYHLQIWMRLFSPISIPLKLKSFFSHSLNICSVYKLKATLLFCPYWGSTPDISLHLIFTR